MEESGALIVVPSGPRTLRNPVRNGMRVTIAVAAGDADRVAEAAISNVLDS